MKLIAFLKLKKTEEIRFGYNVLKSILDEVKSMRRLK